VSAGVSVRCIGLAGLGYLGRGIAQCLLEHGFHVIALENRALETDITSDLFTLASGARELAECELIIESITEDLAAKEALYDELERHVSPTVPIASNTSSIPITRLQSRRQHPNRFAGMHWAPPAYASRFLEIVRGDLTDDATLSKIASLARELGKQPAIVQKDIPGFVANRIAYAIYREAIYLLEEGVADLETIDTLCRHSLGLWAPICGPFRWIDITGGPAIYAKAMENILPTLSNRTEVPDTMQRRREKNDKFYHYGPEEPARWQARLREHALRLWEEGS
jgi:3-hydroxybutyryl-CoA dehydrogenase